jgi:hypothetical protein
MEYFVNHDLLANLERLSEQDKPHGIKCKLPPLTFEEKLTSSRGAEGIKQFDITTPGSVLGP